MVIKHHPDKGGNIEKVSIIHLLINFITAYSSKKFRMPMTFSPTRTKEKYTTSMVKKESNKAEVVAETWAISSICSWVAEVEEDHSKSKR